ncbi:hypothetical protein HMPREF1555_00218 [Porphyromonas gingivalis F0570]|uniref:Uncharacterized protein n=1 Tax=Porphyromonas gingivalis F0570 TaxID=1227271 RepID=A0A0E2LSZ8_PORGN|nr:hypothetical protein HMPREF1555_00218 [Porphyromonas gingivalis F0570]
MGASVLSAYNMAFWRLRLIYKSFSISIYIEIVLYINGKQFIYKLKMIYI